MSDKEDLDKCYNKKTNKYEFTCKCGKFWELNIRKVLVFGMHKLRCKKCNEIIISV